MAARRKRRRRRRGGCLSALFKFIFLLALIAVVSGGILWKMGELDGLTDMAADVAADMARGREIPYEEPESATREAVSTGKYYFDQLSAEEQSVYQEILQGLKDHEEEIYVHEAESEKANQICQYVLRDFPDIFWCRGNVTSRGYGGEEPYTVLEPEYEYDRETSAQMQAEIEESAEEFLAGIPEDSSDYEKILAVYEYVVNTTEYDDDAEDDQNIYSVFVRKRSICAGYSRAVQYLLEKLGVFCTYVTGTAADGSPHAWNLVLCGGDYYYVDATWGDPVFQNKEMQFVSYDYMCSDDSQLFQTHTPDDTVELPACTHMEQNYYVKNGMYFDSYDAGKALELMNDSISKKERLTVLKFSDSDVYAQAKEDLLENVISRAARNLADWYNLSEVNYSYLDDKNLNKMVVYWEYK